MLKSKKGVSFVAVVGSVFFMVLVATICTSMVLNNGNLVNKYANNNKLYNKTSDALKQAGNLLVEESGGSGLSEGEILSLVNTTLELPTLFGIDELTNDNITVVARDTLNGIPQGKQVKLTREGFYINVFLSDDGSQKALSNIFFNSDTSLDFVYKTGFLTTSYLYENGLFYDNQNRRPYKFSMNDSDTNKVAQAVESNDAVYNSVLPKEYIENDYRFEYDTEKSSWQYSENYVDNKLMDEAIKCCFPSTWAGSKWKNNKITSFAANTVYHYTDDVVLSEVGNSADTISLGQNSTVYIYGNLDMNQTAYKSSNGTTTYYTTKLSLDSGATLFVMGDIIISNSTSIPYITVGDKANIICAGDIKISGQHDADKTTNSNFFKWYANGKKPSNLLYSLALLFYGSDKIDAELSQIKGNLEGTWISGNNFSISTTTITGEDPELLMPIRATIYADKDIDLREAFLQFTSPSFFFASYVRFTGEADQSLSTVIDHFLDRMPDSGYLFIIIDDGVEYVGKTDSLKANIYTTNQQNTDAVVTQIGTVYEASGKTGNSIINSIFDWIGINQDIQNIQDGEVDVDVENLGLPKILTEGSVDQSYTTTVKK